MTMRSRSKKSNEHSSYRSGSRRKGRSLEQRIEDMPVKKASTLSNVLFAADIFFVILIVLFFTGNLGEYRATLFLLPILAYVVLESPGFRLRTLKKTTWVLLADVVSVAAIVILCIEIDRILMDAGAAEILLSVLYLAVMVVMSEFLCRNKWAYYLMMPVTFVAFIAIALRHMPGYEILASTIGAVAAISVTLSYRNHRYYFGFGRDDRILALVSESKWGEEEAMRQTFSEEEMRQMVFVRERKPWRERIPKKGETPEKENAPRKETVPDKDPEDGRAGGDRD